MSRIHHGWQEVQGICIEIVRQMYEDNWKPDLIVALSPGGSVPAILLSKFLGVKMINVDVELSDTTGTGPEINAWVPEDAAKGRQILVVSDINNTGATLNWLYSDWDSSAGATLNWGDNVRVAVLYDNDTSTATYAPDYAGVSINNAENTVYMIFPWEEWWV